MAVLFVRASSITDLHIFSIEKQFSIKTGQMTIRDEEIRMSDGMHYSPTGESLRKQEREKSNGCRKAPHIISQPQSRQCPP